MARGVRDAQTLEPGQVGPPHPRVPNGTTLSWTSVGPPGSVRCGSPHTPEAGTDIVPDPPSARVPRLADCDPLSGGSDPRGPDHGEPGTSVHVPEDSSIWTSRSASASPTATLTDASHLASQVGSAAPASRATHYLNRRDTERSPHAIRRHSVLVTSPTIAPGDSASRDSPGEGAAGVQ